MNVWREGTKQGAQRREHYAKNGEAVEGSLELSVRKSSWHGRQRN